MQNTSQYRRNPNFIFRRIVDETVLVPIHKDVSDMSCIYTLNEIGAFIWEQLDQPRTQMYLQNAITQAYDADPEVIRQDLTQFLDEMTGIGALQEG